MTESYLDYCKRYIKHLGLDFSDLEFYLEDPFPKQIWNDWQSEIKLLKQELKREREGNDYASKCVVDAHGNAVRIINQRKIKSEDL